jgi:CheY-like chemotaxis protein
LCAKIRQFDSVTPIIFFSGDEPARDDAELECGVQDYVLKPVRQSAAIHLTGHEHRLE